MPQGRRKIPFSGKAKKEQLKSKKQGNSSNEFGVPKKSNMLLKNTNDDVSGESSIQKMNYQPNKSGTNINRYALQFYKETDAEIRERKELARHSLKNYTEKELEINVDDYFVEELDFPKRPDWSFNVTRETLESKENKYFREYIENIEKKFNWKEMSYFELNLETWRQLWRVLEMSDIILLIVDIRFPALMFPSSLYDYITKTLKKEMILVLNKIDLVPTPAVAAWKNYFLDKYPKLNVLMFTTMPGYNLVGKHEDKAGLLIRRRKGRLRMAAEGTKLLLNACKDIVKNEVDLSSWEQKIKDEASETFTDEKLEIGETIEANKTDTGYFEHERFKNGILTIGCLGQPNVGKSSVMNAIMGKKVVSVSKTPGHTKHFQTIFITPNVRFCDCPGLTFPSKVPKVLQVLMGSFPIAQLREPFTAIQYLAERLDMPKLLRIQHPENDVLWSAMDVCDGWAKQRGYLTAKAARLDSYRAANSLLRMALDGKICLYLRPPQYFENKSMWEKHPDVASVNWIKGNYIDEIPVYKPGDLASNHSDDESASVTSDKSTGVEENTEENTNSEAEEEDDNQLQFGTNKFSALMDE